MIQKLRLEKWITIQLKRGGVSMFNVEIWPLYIKINLTFRDWKVKTCEMA